MWKSYIFFRPILKFLCLSTLSTYCSSSFEYVSNRGESHLWFIKASPARILRLFKMKNCHNFNDKLSTFKYKKLSYSKWKIYIKTKENSHNIYASEESFYFKIKNISITFFFIELIPKKSRTKNIPSKTCGAKINSILIINY